MSVVVLGMEMPKSCNDCRFAVDGWCYAHPKQANGDALNHRVRTNWCPIRPLPEKHGRLIDADEMEANGSALYSKLHIDDESMQEWRELIPFDEVPTIIEAEGKNYERN